MVLFLIVIQINKLIDNKLIKKSQNNFFIYLTIKYIQHNCKFILAKKLTNKTGIRIQISGINR